MVIEVKLLQKENVLVDISVTVYGIVIKDKLIK